MSDPWARTTPESRAALSSSASMHVESEHRAIGMPSWYDVARAYDAGMRHAIENRQNARRQLDGIQRRKAPMDGKS